jgi:ferredoxin like protein
VIPTEVAARLAANTYTTDEDASHITVDQAKARASGMGPKLVAVCPAGVYSLAEGPTPEDQLVEVEYAACLECGACAAIDNAGVLEWHYPAGGMGINFREG